MTLPILGLPGRKPRIFENILNRQGYLLQEGNMQWVSITDDRPRVKQTTNIIGKLQEDGSIDGQAICYYYDYAKSFMLDSTIDDDEEDKFFDKKPMGLKILSSKMDQTSGDDQPLQQNIEFHFQPQNTDNYFFVNPQLLASQKPNPFRKETRFTDVDFGCNQEIFSSFQLEIPPSFELDHPLTNMVIRAPDSSFYFKRLFSMDSTHVRISLLFQIQRSIFGKEEYKGVQEFFNRIYALMAEEIVLRKKK